MKGRRAITSSRRGPQGEYLTLSAQVVGQGEPIILIHGLAGSSRWWRYNIPVLAQHYRLYLIDLPGFGTMRSRRWHTALDDVASGIVHWMERSGLAQANLIGHSMGGYLSLWIAAHHPECIRRLVLVSPAGIPHIRSLHGYAFPLLKALCSLQPRFFSLLISDALRAGPLTILRAAQDLLTRDIRDCLLDISAPTLLIWGEDDSLVPPVLGKLLSLQLPQARLLLLKKAGHVSMFEQPDQFNSAVLDFLAETISTDGRGAMGPSAFNEPYMEEE